MAKMPATPVRITNTVEAGIGLAIGFCLGAALMALAGAVLAGLIGVGIPAWLG